MRTPSSKGVEKLAAADILAGFYRKTAVELVGRFAQGTTDLAAAVDLGLALRRAGYRGVLEPQSLTYADPSLRRPSVRPAAVIKPNNSSGAGPPNADRSPPLRLTRGYWPGKRCKRSFGRRTSPCSGAGCLVPCARVVRFRVRWSRPRSLRENSLIRPPHFPMGGRDSRKQPAARK